MSFFYALIMENQYLRNLNNELLLISIIVPVYNVETYLPKCIDSILSQTYKNIEVILVNDGSTDDSLSICRAYADKYDNIKLVDKPNGGLSSARNAGLQIAQGEYIGYVDSDDWIEPDMFSKLLNASLMNDADISICGVFRDYSDKSIPQKSPFGVFNREEALEKLLANYQLQDYAVNKLYKKDLWNDIRYPEGKFFEDILTTYKTFKLSNRIAIIDDCLYHYVQREGSIARGTLNPRQFQMLEAIDTIKRDNDITDRYEEVLKVREAKVIYTLLWNLFVLGDKNSIKLYRKDGKALLSRMRKVRNCASHSKYLSRSKRVNIFFSFLPFRIYSQLFRLNRISLKHS